jgi:hypothetical protein
VASISPPSEPPLEEPEPLEPLEPLDPLELVAPFWSPGPPDPLLPQEDAAIAGSITVLVATASARNVRYELSFMCIDVGSNRGDPSKENASPAGPIAPHQRLKINVSNRHARILHLLRDAQRHPGAHGRLRRRRSHATFCAAVRMDAEARVTRGSR